MRVLLVALGVALGGYGAVLLWENPPVIIMRILVWSVVGVVLHDLVFAPVCVALGFAGCRLIPGNWWPPIAVGAFCSVVLVFLAIPVYGKPGMRPDNMTVLDRNYPLGFWISLALVWACVPLFLLMTTLRRRGHSNSTHVNLGDSTQQLPVGQDEVVEQQSADDVERQPPPV